MGAAVDVRGLIKPHPFRSGHKTPQFPSTEGEIVRNAFGVTFSNKILNSPSFCNISCSCTNRFHPEPASALLGSVGRERRRPSAIKQWPHIVLHFNFNFNIRRKLLQVAAKTVPRGGRVTASWIQYKKVWLHWLGVQFEFDLRFKWIAFDYIRVGQ